MACLIIATATCTASAQSISLGHTTPAASTAHAGGLSYSYSIGQTGRLVIAKPQDQASQNDGKQSERKADNANKAIKATVSAYPNPCTDYLTIKTGITQPVNASIQIIDSKGGATSTTETTISDDGELTIDLSRLATGKYIIRIITGNGTYTATAIKI